MSELWPHFTKENPCPSCGHYYPQWTCRAGKVAYVCMRVDSGRPNVNSMGGMDGGWIHRFDGNKPIVKLPKRIQMPKVKMDFEKMQLGFATTFEPLDKLIYDLGVNSDSIVSLCVGYSRQDKAWAIPMRDGDNKIIGIHLRCDDGSKKCVTGSQGGLFIPQVEPQKLAYICEGASSCAALLTMGFYAIGRFNCNTGADMVKVALKRLGVSRIVICGDNDSLKSAPNGKTFRPGQDGALRLKKELGIMSCIYTTPNPIKDCRQLLNEVGIEDARAMINSSVANKIWTRC